VVYKLAANIRAKIGPLLAFSHLSAESADYIDIALAFFTGKTDLPSLFNC
jgi:hypothetical protein